MKTLHDAVSKDAEETLEILKILINKHAQLQEYHDLLEDALNDDDNEKTISELANIADILVEIRIAGREAMSICAKYVSEPEEEESEFEDETEEDAVEDLLDEFGIDALDDPEDDSDDE